MAYFLQLKYRHILTIIVIAVVSIAMHWSIFQRDLIGIHVWRQSQTQLNISNFYRVDQNILHPRVNIINAAGEQQILRTDFPLMQWVVSKFYGLFGEHIAVTRISMFILGITTITGFFLLALLLFKKFWVAAITAWAFSFSPVFYYYTLNPLPDNLALCFAVWSLCFFMKYRKSVKLLHVTLSAALLGLAALVKLPYIVFGGIYACSFITGLLSKKNDVGISTGKKLAFFVPYLLFAIPAALWYIKVIPEWGDNPVLKGNLNYTENTGKIMELLTYHYKVMFPTLLLNYASLILLFCGVIAVIVQKYYRKVVFWQIAAGAFMVLLYFAYEFFPIDTIHDYYMMPFLPFLFLLVGTGVHFLFLLSPYSKYIIAISVVLMPVLTYGTVQDNWTVERSYANDNLFIYQEELKNAAPSDARCIFLNDVSLHIWPYLLNKKGYVFSADRLPKEWIEDMIRTKQVKYMYSDSRLIDERPDYQYLFDSVILQRGTIKLIQLKNKAALYKK